MQFLRSKLDFAYNVVKATFLRAWNAAGIPTHINIQKMATLGISRCLVYTCAGLLAMLLDGCERRSSTGGITPPELQQKLVSEEAGYEYETAAVYSPLKRCAEILIRAIVVGDVEGKRRRRAAKVEVTRLAQRGRHLLDGIAPPGGDH